MKCLASDLAESPDVAVKQAGNARECLYMHTYIHAYSTYIYFEKDNSSSSSFLRGDFGFGGNALRRHPDWADINCETLKQKLTSRCHNIGLRPGTIWQHEQVGHEPLPAAPPPTPTHNLSALPLPADGSVVSGGELLVMEKSLGSHGAD